MSIERRDFIAIGAAGIAGGLFNGELGFGQAAQRNSSGRLRGGAGSLVLEGRLKAGTLKLEAEDFVDGADRALIIHATLNATKLYQAMFSQDHGREVFAQIKDEDHRTTLVVSGTDDKKIARLTIWHDREAPESFQIDAERFLKTHNLKESVMNAKAASLNLLGKRKPPAFTSDEIEEVFGKDPALLQFMRGRRAMYESSADVDVLPCEVIRFFPGGGILHLGWEAYSPEI